MIETYLIEDAETVIADGEDGWKEKCEELGLTGQLKLTENDAKVIPFPKMSAAEQAVYTELLDRHSKVEEYDYEPIPLRVLSLIALCRQENYFTELAIWYNPQYTDPILIGRTPIPGQTWGSYTYIIARWGDELKSLNECAQDAARKYVAGRRLKLEQKIRDCKQALETLEETAAAKFNGISVTEVYV